MNTYQNDNGEPVLNLFTCYADDIYSADGSISPPFPETHDIATWNSINLSDRTTYDSVSQYSLTVLSPGFSVDDNYYRKSLSNDLSEKTLPWDNENSLQCDYTHSSISTSRFANNDLNMASRSLITLSGSNIVCPSPPMNEFANVFDSDFTILPPNDRCSKKLHARSPRFDSVPAHSPSPSCSSLDASETKSCGSRDSSPSNTENDLQNPRRRFPCLIIGCNRRFTSQYTLKVHMEAHKPKPRVTFPCTLGCTERFSRQHDRLRHEVAKHGKICEFLCDECGRFFSSKKTLGNHKCPVAQGGTRWVDS
ncbi:hypothetical protein BDQ17DRAFT_385409 [Cyathus striatus]|nr:hypothetical protein BDQ17DRAFT_385409 [Cyathus striatus]